MLTILAGGGASLGSARRGKICTPVRGAVSLGPRSPAQACAGRRAARACAIQGNCGAAAASAAPRGGSRSALPRRARLGTLHTFFPGGLGRRAHAPAPASGGQAATWADGEGDEDGSAAAGAEGGEDDYLPSPASPAPLVPAPAPAPRLTLGQQWRASLLDMRVRPWQYLSIPIVAACVGYITNYVGVKMLFYPIDWTGIPILRFPHEPFGWIGWQGIVPAKRFKMAEKMVDITITKLLSVPEIFARLDPGQMANLLEPTVKSKVLAGMVPGFLTRVFLRKASRGVIAQAEAVVDIKGLVVSGLTDVPTVMGDFFQRVGYKELVFLVDSGFGFGLLLGVLQMIQWMLYPKAWTLAAGGAVVGFITNWIALKWIFEPLNPTKIGPFVFQGMFLQRQNEVADMFSEYIATTTLCASRVWADVLGGTTAVRFKEIVSGAVPLPAGHITSIVEHLKGTVGAAAEGISHPIHAYTDQALNIQATLASKMKAMTTIEFEQVLHPIFQVGCIL